MSTTTRGNRTKRTHIASRNYEEYAWGYCNWLISVTFRDNTDALTKKVEYTYDVFDRRIGKKLDAGGNSTFETTERYVYDGENIAMPSTAGDVIHRYCGQRRITGSGRWLYVYRHKSRRMSAA